MSVYKEYMNVKDDGSKDGPGAGGAENEKPEADGEKA